jgi:carboxypeptidase Taq
MSETDWSVAVADSPAAADFTAACTHAHQVAVLASVESLVHWDEQTMLPPRGGGFRADQAEAMAAVVHARRTDPAQGERLARLVETDLANAGPAEVQATIRLLYEDFEKQSRLPSRLVETLARTAIEAQQAWTQALAHSDWKLLEPQLEQMFSLKREQAASSGLNSIPTTR